MRRVQDLIHSIRKEYPNDNFFADFEASLERWPLKRHHYQRYEQAFETLTARSWDNLRKKAVAHFNETRPYQKKGPFFDQLNDAIACQWLVRRGFTAVTVLEEVPGDKNPKCPDISFLAGTKKLYCETKTINTSVLEYQARATPKYRDSKQYAQLGPTFFKKIDDAIETATKQIQAVCNFGLIFLLVSFDDFTMTYYARHRIQIATHMRNHHGLPFLIKFGMHGSLRLEGTHALLKNAKA